MASDVQILDIGTAFNVKNIEGRDTLEVYVQEGEVHMFTEADNGLRLQAHEVGYYIKSKKRFEKASVIEVENPTAYINRQFNFRNTPLKKVLKQINEVYEVQLRLSDADLGNCRITVSFNNDDIETIASIISETMGWEVHAVGQTRILTGLSCD
jgi:transmembrane sensor